MVPFLEYLSMVSQRLHEIGVTRHSLKLLTMKRFPLKHSGTALLTVVHLQVSQGTPVTQDVERSVPKILSRSSEEFSKDMI